MFKNDERYWDINLLNKWFAISSIIFLAVTVWTFIDDNDDEFRFISQGNTRTNSGPWHTMGPPRGVYSARNRTASS